MESNGIGCYQNKNGRWQDYHFLRRGNLATLKGEQMQNRNVQIPYELFLQLLQYFLMDNYDGEEKIRLGLEQKEEVQEYAKKHYGFPEDQRLFPIVARTLQKRLKKYEALTGVKPIRVHDIRHSHVAYLIYQGVEPLIIKERLGHKDIQMTLNTYGHLYPSQQKKVAEMLDNKR